VAWRGGDLGASSFCAFGGHTCVPLRALCFVGLRRHAETTARNVVGEAASGVVVVAALAVAGEEVVATAPVPHLAVLAALVAVTSVKKALALTFRPCVRAALRLPAVGMAGESPRVGVFSPPPVVHTCFTHLLCPRFPQMYHCTQYPIESTVCVSTQTCSSHTFDLDSNDCFSMLHGFSTGT
jgi:hypothetical protein